MRRNGKNGQSANSALKVDKSQFAKFIRKVKLESNSILVFSEGSITHEGLESLASAIEQMGFTGVTLLVLKDVDDMQNLNEEDMNKVGWFKAAALRNMIERMREKESLALHDKDIVEGRAIGEGGEDAQ